MHSICLRILLCFGLTAARAQAQPQFYFASAPRPAATPQWNAALRELMPELRRSGSCALLAHTLQISGISYDRFAASDKAQKESWTNAARLMLQIRGDALAVAALHEAADALSSANPKRRAAVADELSYLHHIYGPYLTPEVSTKLGKAREIARARARQRKALDVSESLRRIASSLSINPEGALDSAVELEVRTSFPQIVDILTSKDGTVGGLVGPLPVPAWLGKKTPVGTPAGVDLKAMPLGPMGSDEKLTLLQYASQNRAINYARDRRIPGVVVKDRVALSFPKETTFLGKTYAPGRHEVDVSRVLNGPVHYMGSQHVKAVSGIELHFRGKLTPGAASREAWTFLDGLGVARPSQHVYSVAPLPLEALIADPELEAALIGDFYGRANLMAEMLSILHLGAGIRKYRNDKNPKITDFAPLSVQRLLGVTQYFFDVGRGLYQAIGDRFKMAWVGFRGADKFDQPGLYGLEFRSVNRYLSDAAIQRYRQYMDNVQRAMLRQRYGIAKEKMKRWLAARSNGGTAQAVARTWYAQPWPDLLESAPSQVKAELGWLFTYKLKRMSEDHIELKMLVHDWANTPLLFENAALQQRVVAAQCRALSRLRRHETENAVMRDFLYESGLYEALQESLTP